MLSLSPKQHGELEYWRLHPYDTWVPWFRGEVEQVHGYPPPVDKVAAYAAEWVNAVATYSRDSMDYYPGRVKLPVGKDYGRLLDVGCGPMGFARAYWRSEVWGVDPLLAYYRLLGYPLRDYGMALLPCYVEDMWMIPQNFFDTIIAVNSLDHVDDLFAAGREICRVAKPGALVRMEVAYHSPSLTEPCEINDGMMAEAFAPLKLEKIEDARHNENFRLTLWSTPEREEQQECPA